MPHGCRHVVPTEFLRVRRMALVTVFDQDRANLFFQELPFLIRAVARPLEKAIVNATRTARICREYFTADYAGKIRRRVVGLRETTGTFLLLAIQRTAMATSIRPRVVRFRETSTASPHLPSERPMPSEEPHGKTRRRSRAEFLTAMRVRVTRHVEAAKPGSSPQALKCQDGECTFPYWRSVDQRHSSGER